MQHIAGYVELTSQMCADLRASEDAWKRLERTARNYENASAEDRAALDRFLEAAERREDCQCHG